jgi:hypothetical protein
VADRAVADQPGFNDLDRMHGPVKTLCCRPMISQSFVWLAVLRNQSNPPNAEDA